MCGYFLTQSLHLHHYINYHVCPSLHASGICHTSPFHHIHSSRYPIGPLLQLGCLIEAGILSRNLLTYFKKILIPYKFIQGRLGSPLFCYNDKNGIQKFGLFGIAVRSQWIKLRKNIKCSNSTDPSKTRMKGFSDSKVAQNMRIHAIYMKIS